MLLFRLTFASAAFEILMERVLKELQWKSILLYLNDVIVYLPYFENNVKRLEEVLPCFRSIGLKFKPNKC